MIQGLELGYRAVPTALPSGIFNGITAAAGSIYVTADGDNNTVHEFRR